MENVEHIHDSLIKEVTIIITYDVFDNQKNENTKKTLKSICNKVEKYFFIILQQFLFRCYVFYVHFTLSSF